MYTLTFYRALLVHLIALRWAGPNYYIAEDYPETFTIIGDNAEVYGIYLPETCAPIRDNSGAPIEEFYVPLGNILVLAVNEAPDAWWYVEWNGNWRNLFGSGNLFSGEIKLSQGGPSADYFPGEW